MMVLTFERSARIVDGRRVRRTLFEQRSALPVSAACLVANAVRETLSSLLAAPVNLRLLEPCIPDARAWNAICADARFYRLRGSGGEAAFVLRAADAVAIAGAAFGESATESRDLSPVENEVVLRAMRALSGALAPVCGREPAQIEPILDINGYVTYFELLLEAPVRARIGVALARDPDAKGAGRMQPDRLLDVEIELSAQFAQGTMAAADFLDLRPGVLVPMKTKIGAPGLLRAGGTVLARGECGTLGERNVLILGGAP